MLSRCLFITTGNTTGNYWLPLDTGNQELLLVTTGNQELLRNLLHVARLSLLLTVVHFCVQKHFNLSEFPHLVTTGYYWLLLVTTGYYLLLLVTTGYKLPHLCICMSLTVCRTSMSLEARAAKHRINPCCSLFSAMQQANISTYQSYHSSLVSMSCKMVIIGYNRLAISSIHILLCINHTS